MKARSQDAAAKPSIYRRRWFKGMAIAVAVIVAFTAAAGAYVYYIFHNYAQDAAQPIESALIRNGAVKVCSGGDAGRGPDNTRPMYTAQYQINIGKTEANQLVARVASDNGFTLSQKDSTGENVEQYVDNTNKKSNYPGFDNGNVELGISVVNGSDKPLTCTTDGKNYATLQADEAHTVVYLGVSLPDGRK